MKQRNETLVCLKKPDLICNNINYIYILYKLILLQIKSVFFKQSNNISLHSIKIILYKYYKKNKLSLKYTCLNKHAAI
jgi:hypothetical protein